VEDDVFVVDFFGQNTSTFVDDSRGRDENGFFPKPAMIKEIGNFNGGKSNARRVYAIESDIGHIETVTDAGNTRVFTSLSTATRKIFG